MKEISITRKLAIAVMLTSLLALFLACSGFLVYNVFVFRQTLERDTLAVSQLIALNGAPAMAFHDEKAAEEALSSLKVKPFVVVAAIYDKNDSLFAKYGEFPDDYNPTKPGTLGARFAKKYLVVFDPVIMNQEKIGTICVLVDAGTQIQRRVISYGLIVVPILFVCFFMAYFFSWKTRQAITAPILELGRIAKIISTRKDYSIRVKALGHDELGQLAEAFNQMLNQIELQNGALKKANEVLEARVEERTRELRHIQKELVDAAGEIEIREHHMRMIIESANDAFIEIDSKGLVTQWNRQAEIVFGWSREEVMGRPLTENIIPEKYRDSHLKGLRHFFATGEGPVLNKRIELSALNREGHEFPIEITIAPVKIENNYVFNAFIHDISERKQVAEALLQSEERFRLIVDTVQDYAVFMLDADGNVRTWNAGAQRLNGYTADEIIGSHFSKFYPEEEIARKKPKKELEWALQKGRYEEEGWRVRKDGSKFWASVVITALRDTKGNLRGFSKIVRNMTERKLAEEALKRAYLELEHSNRELEQFAYVASHDLQEPLRMVASYCQLLEKRYKSKLDKDAGEFIDFAVDGAKRMQGLISDLLAYSRVDTKGKSFVLLSCEKVLERALFNLKSSTEDSSAVITHDPLPEVMGDDTQLILLFQNLIGNAIKFCKAHPPRIHVGAETKGIYWTFSVHDNGIGIDPQYFERIFVMFQRLHTREEYPGTGIGLAICKKIVERHGGRIWAESQSGQGTTFYFTLPTKGGQS